MVSGGNVRQGLGLQTSRVQLKKLCIWSCSRDIGNTLFHVEQGKCLLLRSHRCSYHYLPTHVNWTLNPATSLWPIVRSLHASRHTAFTSCSDKHTPADNRYFTLPPPCSHTRSITLMALAGCWLKDTYGHYAQERASMASQCKPDQAQVSLSPVSTHCHMLPAAHNLLALFHSPDAMAHAHTWRPQVILNSEHRKHHMEYMTAHVCARPANHPPTRSLHRLGANLVHCALDPLLCTKLLARTCLVNQTHQVWLWPVSKDV